MSEPAVAPMTMPPASRLSKRQKAAIIVRLMVAEGIKLPLDRFPEELQVELTRQMTTMRYIDRMTLHSVVDEFTEELEAIGLSFPGGLEVALDVLEGTISPSTSARLRKQAGFTLTGDPWERIGEFSVDRLLAVITDESDEIAAVLLSKLKVSKAADILGQIPGERARRIAYAVSQTGTIEPHVVQRIGLSLAGQLDAQPARAFASGPVERVGAILNFSPSGTRDTVLAGLEEDDKGFADEVRRAIFTFANIPARIDPRDVPKILRAVDPKQLVQAMAGAKGEAEKSATFLLQNISQRMAAAISEEITAAGAVPLTQAEAAQSSVVAAIRALEEAGEISLIAGDA